MRKIYLVVVLISLIFLTSCGNMEIGTRTDIKKAGNVNFTLKVAYDKMIGNLINNNLIEKQLQIDNVDINKYTNGKMNVEEVKINLKGVESLSTNEKIKDVIEYNVERQDYFYKIIYDINIKIGEELFDIRRLYDSKENLIYINSIPFSNTVSFPGKLLNTNANEQLSPNEIRWTSKIGDLNQNTNMTFSYEVNTFWKPIVLIIVIAIIIMIIFINRYFKNKRKRAKINIID